MGKKNKKKLGRGMSHLLDGSLSSILDPSGRAVRPQPQQPAPSPLDPVIPVMDEPILPRPRRLADVRLGVSARPFDVVSICSGKGGTGKSVLTSNLGVLLGESTRVSVLDADLGLANIHILCNLIPDWDISHVLAGEKHLEEIMVEGPRGMRIIPGGSGIPELANLSDGMFEVLFKEVSVLDGLTDLLLVDAPSGIDRQALLFLLASDQALVVTTIDITALTDAYAIIKTTHLHRPALNIMVVVNRAPSHAEGMDTFHKISHVARKFLGRELTLGGVIPFDEAVEESVTSRTPVVLSSPGSPAARAMAALASRVGVFHGRSQRAGQPFASRLRRLLASPPLGG